MNQEIKDRFRIVAWCLFAIACSLWLSSCRMDLLQEKLDEVRQQVTDMRAKDK